MRVVLVLAIFVGLRPVQPRLECEVGWGQYNDQNIELRIKKEWTRICTSYCWTMRTTDPTKMMRLIGGEWDEEQFYSRFWIKGCGGMFGTELDYDDETACDSEYDEDANVDGQQILVDKDRHDQKLRSSISMDFSCCSKMGGCDAAFSLSRRRHAIVNALIAALCATIFLAR
ncbi:hypothetical protein CTAYLR_003568 [Chrysophaeum taylorii]|uniref:Uncharacterized protein n=1 Tax=Chrysophaeum taylorii TaxID=2483200 RepID=A0AAD7UL42_9STRA|nr:hypothetical protein CTAYLR_003568 [Chrysophaeum taylorii]